MGQRKSRPNRVMGRENAFTKKNSAKAKIQKKKIGEKKKVCNCEKGFEGCQGANTPRGSFVFSGKAGGGTRGRD